jgi:hypothetical protein
MNRNNGSTLVTSFLWPRKIESTKVKSHHYLQHQCLAWQKKQLKSNSWKKNKNMKTKNQELKNKTGLCLFKCFLFFIESFIMTKEISDLQFTITNTLRSFVSQVFVDLLVLANKKM